LPAIERSATILSSFFITIHPPCMPDVMSQQGTIFVPAFRLPEHSGHLVN
jgi:hypothetical protein